jgi:signal transduction histidine kinase
MTISPDTQASVVRSPGSRRWWHWAADAGVVVFLIAANVTASRHIAGPPASSGAVLITSLVPLPLLVRRRWPLTAFLVVSALCFTQWALKVWLRPGDLGFLVALFAVTSFRRERRVAFFALAVGLGGVFLAWQIQPTRRAWSDIGAPIVVIVAVWLIGRTVGTRRAYLRALEERAVRLENERDALDRAAVAEERARIAREMHDVVAHRVGVMVAQADGASYAFDARPDQARAALGVIASTGRAALSELRQMLGVLRAADAASGTSPQPGLGDIEQLVAEMRAAGLPVRLTTIGSAVTVDASAGLTAYRVVQESLTNTLKHAGIGTPVEVELATNATQLRVRVRDEGELPAATEAGGHGLVGMRERVTMLGGTFQAGPGRPGGWQVDVTIPVGHTA